MWPNTEKSSKEKLKKICVKFSTHAIIGPLNTKKPQRSFVYLQLRDQDCQSTLMCARAYTYTHTREVKPLENCLCLQERSEMVINSEMRLTEISQTFAASGARMPSYVCRGQNVAEWQNGEQELLLVFALLLTHREAADRPKIGWKEPSAEENNALPERWKNRLEQRFSTGGLSEPAVFFSL